MKIYWLTAAVQDTFWLKAGGCFYPLVGASERQQSLKVPMELNKRVRDKEKDQKMMVCAQGLRAAEGELG